MLHVGTFEKLFPTPLYLTMPGAGVDVSDALLRVVVLDPRTTHRRLVTYGTTVVPAGALTNGTITNGESFVEALRKMKDDFELSFVRFSLPEEHAFVFHTFIPRVNFSDLRSAITLQLEQHVPLPEDNIVFGYEVISTSHEGHLVSVTAFPSDIVRGYVTAFESAGLVPVCAELESHAIARSILPSGDKGTYLIFDYGNERSGISIVSRGAVVFTSTLAVGSQSLTQAISKYFKIPIEEANAMKEARGILYNTDDQDFFFTLINNVSSIRDEINKHYIYWHTGGDKEHFSDHIDAIYLCGGGSHIPGFAEYLAASLRVRVNKADVWCNLFSLEETIPQMSFNESLSYATAVGLALGDRYDD